MRGLDALGSSSHHVGLPILGDLREPTNAAGVAGVLWMAWAAGMLVGSLAVRPLLARPMDRAPSLVFYVSTVVMSGGFIGIFWLGAWPAMLAAALAAGFADALSEISFKQALQRLPDERRGQAFGLSHTVINAGFVVGLAMTGLALAPERLAGWVLLLHGIPTVAAMGCALWSIRQLRRRVEETPWRT